MYLFVDTTEFDRRGRNLRHPEFAKIASFARKGILTLLVPDVILMEMRGHLQEHVARKSETALATIEKLRSLGGDPGLANQASDLVSKLAESSESQFASFFGTPGIETLPCDSVDLAAIVEDYFAGRAPFGDGDKKCEFPDAIAIATLRLFSEARSAEVHVVSHDGDMKRACERFPDQFTLSESLAVALNAALHENEDAVLDAATDAVHAQQEDLVQEAFKEAVTVEYYLLGDDRVDSYVEDVHVLRDLDSTITIIDIDPDEEIVEVSGDLRFRIGASVSSADDEFMYRDSDTRDFVYLATLKEGIEADVEASVHGTLDLSTLLQGSAEWSAGPSISSGDVAIGSFDVVSRRSTADDPSWYE